MWANLLPATLLSQLLTPASHFAPAGKFMWRRRLLAGSLALPVAMKKVKAV